MAEPEVTTLTPPEGVETEAPSAQPEVPVAPEVKETPSAADGTKAPETPGPTLESVQAERDALQQKVDDAEHRRKSAEGRVKDRQSTTREVADLRQQVSGLADLIETFVDHQADPNSSPESLKQGLEKVRSKTAKSSTAVAFKASYSEAYDSLSIQAEEKGYSMDDPELYRANPLLNRAAVAFNDAVASGVVTDLTKAERTFSAALRQVAPSTKSSTSPNGKTETPSAPPKVEAGIVAAGAGQSDQDLVNKMASGVRMSPADIAKAGEAMDKGVYPKL